ncbi:MAG: leucyl aminopeptidase [Buchnera aphidicola (Eriosoma harunire)]
MDFKIIQNIEYNKDIECLVLFIFSSLKLSDIAYKIDVCNKNYISQLIDNNNFTGEIGQVLLICNISYLHIKKILLVGCGNDIDFDRIMYNKIIKSSVALLDKHNIRNVIYMLEDIDLLKCSMYWKIRLFIEYVEKHLYIFSMFKTNIKKNNNFKFKISFYIGLKDNLFLSNLGLKHGCVISEGIKITKDVSNTPPNICNSLYFISKVKELFITYKNNISIDIITEKDMKKLGMNAFLAVGHGSSNPSCMMIMKYFGLSHKSTTINIVLIGKGVTFDTGGISLKPAKLMYEMKYDMCGAAAVLGVMYIICVLQLPINIVSVFALSENMLDKHALRPGDVVTTMSNQTVEVLNTDAEGRLILCDVLTYIKKYNSNIVIDVATLTGSCVVALGRHFTGLMSNSNILSKWLIKAGKETGDEIWRLPIVKEYQADLHSYVADITNMGADNPADAIIASCFLSRFVGHYKWAHLDIAGTAWVSGSREGATGRPVLLLTQLIFNMLNIIPSL